MTEIQQVRAIVVKRMSHQTYRPLYEYEYLINGQRPGEDGHQLYDAHKGFMQDLVKDAEVSCLTRLVIPAYYKFFHL